MPFRPLSDRILVKVDPIPEAPEYGLGRPTSQQEQPTTGVVVAIGPGVIAPVMNETTYTARFANAISIGARIHWNRYAGREITIDGEKLLLLRLSEVNGVYEEQEGEAKQ